MLVLVAIAGDPHANQCHRQNKVLNTENYPFTVCVLPPLAYSEETLPC